MNASEATPAPDERSSPLGRNILKKIAEKHYFQAYSFDKVVFIGQCFEIKNQMHTTGQILLEKLGEITVKPEDMSEGFDFLAEREKKFYLLKWPLP